jgi:hypothetical protein
MRVQRYRPAMTVLGSVMSAWAKRDLQPDRVNQNSTIGRSRRRGSIGEDWIQEIVVDIGTMWVL